MSDILTWLRKLRYRAIRECERLNVYTEAEAVVLTTESMQTRSPETPINNCWTGIILQTNPLYANSV